MGVTYDAFRANEEFLFFNIWVTMRCNFRCRYCYEMENKSNVIMSYETAKQTVSFILDISRKNNCRSIWINFHGGEPLLNHKIIDEILDLFESSKEELKIYTSLTTNGSIKAEHTLSRIKEITVSIDGSKEAHDKNRIMQTGEGTYDVAIKNALDYLKKFNNIRLRMVVTPNNTKHLYDGVVQLAEYGFRCIIPGIDYFNKEWDDNDFETIYQQFVKIYNYRKKRNFDEELIIGLLDTPIKKVGRCSVGCDGYQIASDGKLYHCTYLVNMPQYEIGDIFNGISKDKVNYIKNICSGNVEECSGCANYNYCSSIKCLFLNKLLTGEYMLPSAVICAEENLKIKLNRLRSYAEVR